MDYKILYKFPSIKDFNLLFDSVGWGNRDSEKIKKHEQASVFSVCIYDLKNIVGMGRVVGDGAYYTIYDIVVDKNYQGKGVGSIIMQEIIKWYESIKDDDSYLYLGASKNKEKFYEKFGFKIRPTSSVGAGMKYEPENF